MGQGRSVFNFGSGTDSDPGYLFPNFSHMCEKGHFLHFSSIWRRFELCECFLVLLVFEVSSCHNNFWKTKVRLKSLQMPSHCAVKFHIKYYQVFECRTGVVVTFLENYNCSELNL